MMTEKIENIWSLFDERKEVIFFLILAICTTALFTEFLSGTEFITALSVNFGILLGANAYGQKLIDGGKIDQ
jgi:hypothetical protein